MRLMLAEAAVLERGLSNPINVAYSLTPEEIRIMLSTAADDTVHHDAKLKLFEGRSPVGETSMFVFAFRDVDDVDERDLAARLKAAGGILRLLVLVPSLSSSRLSHSEIARARLAVWYIAETLALHGHGVTVSESDDDEDGDTEVVFDAIVSDIDGLVPKLCWMAPAFDPETKDDGTAWFDFTCEMQGWLEDRKDASTTFPELKADYEADAQESSEQDSEMDDD